MSITIIIRTSMIPYFLITNHPIITTTTIPIIRVPNYPIQYSIAPTSMTQPLNKHQHPNNNSKRSSESKKHPIYSITPIILTHNSKIIHNQMLNSSIIITKTQLLITPTTHL